MLDTVAGVGLVSGQVPNGGTMTKGQKMTDQNGTCYRCEDDNVPLTSSHGSCLPCAGYLEDDWRDAVAVRRELAAIDRAVTR